MKRSHFEQSRSTRAPRGAVRTLRASLSFFFISPPCQKGGWRQGRTGLVARLVQLKALPSFLSVQFLGLRTGEAFQVCQRGDDFGHVFHPEWEGARRSMFGSVGRFAH